MSNTASTFLKETNPPCQNYEEILDEDLLEETPENEGAEVARKQVVGGIFLLPSQVAENALFADPSFLQHEPTCRSKCQQCLGGVVTAQEEECKNCCCCCCCLFTCQTKKLIRSRWCKIWCHSSHDQLKDALISMWSKRAVLSLILIGSTSMLYLMTMDVSRFHVCPHHHP